jgi:hypothetical protein
MAMYRKAGDELERGRFDRAKEYAISAREFEAQFRAEKASKA